MHLGKQPICALKAVLYKWPDLVASPGNFSFPFELKVYDNLLPSFHALGNLGCFGKIKYSLGAQLHATDRQPLKFKGPIFVFTNSITLPQDMYPQYLSRDCPGYGSVFYCFKKEYTTSKVWIDRNIFGNNDDIEINFETNLSEFSANIARVEIEVNKVLTVKANKKNPRVHTQVVNMLNAEEKPEIEAFSGATRCNFKVSIQSILNNEHCYTMSSKLIKCFFVLTFRLYTDNYCWKCYGFDEADLGIVLLPFQTQTPIIAPPITAEQWKARFLPQSSINPSIQDSNNQNPLILNSFVLTNKPEFAEEDTSN